MIVLKRIFEGNAYLSILYPLLSAAIIAQVELSANAACWLMFFGFIPFFHQLEKNNSFWHSIFASFIFQIFYYAIFTHWVFFTLKSEYGYSNILSSIYFLIYTLLNGWHFVLATAVWKAINRIPKLKTDSLLTLAIFIGLAEMYMPRIFPWHFGYLWLKGDWGGHQWADLIGFQGLSTLTLIINISIYKVLKWRKYRLLGGVLIFVFILLFNRSGKYRQKLFQKTDASIQIAAIHSVRAEKKWDKKNGHWYESKKKIEGYIDLTEKFLEKQKDKPDLIVWPEGAVAYPINSASFSFFKEKFVHEVRNWETPLILGAPSEDKKSRSLKNSMFFIEPQSGLLSDFYSKSVLLPFGEYIPGAERFPFFKKILPVLSTYNSGTQSVSTYFFLGINWGPQICYEGLFPQKSYLSAKQGSQVLINLTSDRPFESKFEAEQHFRATAARSIEFRIPMIRVADSGYNGVIWADGTQKVDYLRTKPEAQSYTLAFKKKPYKTMYMILFNFWGFVYILNWPLIVLVKEILF